MLAIFNVLKALLSFLFFSTRTRDRRATKRKEKEEELTRTLAPNYGQREDADDDQMLLPLQVQVKWPRNDDR